MIRKIIIRVVVFICVAFGTALLVNKLNNSNLDNISKEMEEPELPLVYCDFEDTVVNPMSGYTQVMSTSLMRDAVVPVNSSYGVDILVDDEQGYGVSYSYELRSIAGDSLIEKGEVAPGSPKNGYTKYEVRFRMDMRENQEYVLVFIINNADGESARYYTRVVNLKEQYAKKIINYAMEFHNTTFIKDVNEDEGNLVYDSLNTTGEGTDYDLSHVNLNSNYDMVSWGGLNPIIVTGIVPTITEIDNEYAVIKMSYVMESMNEGVSHFFTVDEYYSVIFDKNTQTAEILAFDRYLESFFDEGYINKDKNCISMGVTKDEKTEYVTSSDNKKLAFVKQGQLWYYDYDTTQITSVFSFPRGNYSDVRTLNTNLDINIASMDDDGNIYFVVYGYMNRGKHEGKNGISLYYFTADDARIQEKFFVECDEPFDVMRQETGRFTYYDEEGYLYYLLDGAIYKVNLTKMTQETIVSGIPSDKFMVSDNRKIVAYPDSEIDEEVTSIIIRNFETEQEFVESGSADDRYLALGFVENDLIFGVANKNDIIVSSNKEAILPLYKIYIVEPGGSIIKEYAKNGVYIMNAKVQTDTIYLERAVKKNNFFADTEADFISYKHTVDSNAMSITTLYDSYAMNQKAIAFPSNMYISASSQYVMTKNKEADNYKELKVSTSTRQDSFYVFDNAGYVGEFNSAGRSIASVIDEGSGLVVDSNGNTIYRCLAATEYNTVADEIDEYPCANIDDTLMTCAYMCIEYIDNRVEYEQIMACDSWESAFNEYTLGVGINISGIDLSTALYFLDRDVPFAARINDGRYVLVISYNSTHIRYYDPMLDEEVKVTREEFEEALSLQSNTMYTYTSQ